jgi:hypothetical protein
MEKSFLVHIRVQILAANEDAQINVWCSVPFWYTSLGLGDHVDSEKFLVLGNPT